MAIDPIQQLASFGYSILIGMGFGVFYDIFRILRRTFRQGNFIVSIQDIIYFIICAFITFLFMLESDMGRIRFFVIIGEVLGGLLYFATISIIIIKIADKIIDRVIIILNFIMQCFIMPIYSIISKIIKILFIPIKIILIILNKSTRKVKFRLKREGIMLYNLTRSKKIRKKNKIHREGKANEKKKR